MPCSHWAATTAADSCTADRCLWYAALDYSCRMETGIEHTRHQHGESTPTIDYLSKIGCSQGKRYGIFMMGSFWSACAGSTAAGCNPQGQVTHKLHSNSNVLRRLTNVNPYWYQSVDTLCLPLTSEFAAAGLTMSNYNQTWLPNFQQICQRRSTCDGDLTAYPASSGFTEALSGAGRLTCAAAVQHSWLCTL